MLFFSDGIPVYVSPLIRVEFVQVKFPRSKKRRIRKKWVKNKVKYWAYRNTGHECSRMESPAGTMLIVSPRFYDKLKETACKLKEMA